MISHYSNFLTLTGSYYHSYRCYAYLECFDCILFFSLCVFFCMMFDLFYSKINPTVLSVMGSTLVLRTLQLFTNNLKKKCRYPLCLPISPYVFLFTKRGSSQLRDHFRRGVTPSESLFGNCV